MIQIPPFKRFNSEIKYVLLTYFSKAVVEPIQFSKRNQQKKCALFSVKQAAGQQQKGKERRAEKKKTIGQRGFRMIWFIFCGVFESFDLQWCHKKALRVEGMVIAP